jgi:hypothetical protein
MRRRSPVRALLAAAVAAAVLVPAASASAAAWQPTAQISQAGINLRDTSARVALGASGDAAAGWIDEEGGGRVVVTRRRAGGAWATPVPVAATGALGNAVLVGVDALGDVTAATTTDLSALQITQ